jgi:outer membrane protein assembly factor BamB
MFGHDAGRTGFQLDDGGLKPSLSLLDAVPLDGDAGQLAEVIADDRFYFTRNVAYIWAVDKQSLALAWKHDCPASFCLVAEFAAGADRLAVLENYLWSGTYELVVLDAGTGDERWRRPAGEFATFLVEGNRLYVLSQEGPAAYLTTRSLFTSVQIARSQIAGFTGNGRPALANGRLFTPDNDEIVAYNLADGQELWRYHDAARVTNDMYSLVAITDTVMVTQGERVIKLNAATTDPAGDVIWSEDLASISCTSSANAAASDGVHFAVTGVCRDEVVVLDLSNGTELWRDTAGPIGVPAATIANGYLYTHQQGQANYLISVYGIGGGTPKYQFPRPVAETSPLLAIDDGLLLTVSIFDDQAIRRYERLPADLATSVDVAALPVCGSVVGGSATYFFDVINNGPGEAEGVKAELTLTDAFNSVTPSQGSCDVGASLCHLGDLSASASARITVTTVFSAAGSHRARILVSGGVARDPDSTNNRARLPVPIQVDPQPSASLDLELLDLEITQAIQNLDNDTRLVQDKPTFVRLYAKTNGDTVRTAAALLHGANAGNGQPLPGSPLSPLPAGQCATLDGDTPDRERLAESYLFELPESWWTGNITFTGEINPDNDLPDANGANDSLEVTTGFTELPPICLRTYPVRTTSGDGNDSSDDLVPFFQELLRDPDDILDRALTMLPTAEIKIFAESNKIEEWEPFAPGGFGPYEVDDSDEGDILDTLWWHAVFGDPIPECDAVGARVHYVGLVHEDTRGNKTGLGIRETGGQENWFRLTSWGSGSEVFDDPFGGMTLAHELGHNYNRRHVDCDGPANPGPYPGDRGVCDIAPNVPDGYYGLDTLDLTRPRVISPTQAGDLMSYRDEIWVSEWTWAAIQNRLCAGNGCTWATLFGQSVASRQPEVTSQGDLLLLSGLISGTLELRQLARLPNGALPQANRLYQEQALARAAAGQHTLKLLDSGGGLLYTQAFTGTEISDSPVPLSHFGLAVPFITGTNQIVLEGAGSLPISVTVSAHPPTVTVLTPNGGEVVTDSLTITWSGHDPDGDQLRYTVRFSGDGGATWRALAHGTSESSVTVDSSLLPGGPATGLVEVIANDGVNTAADRSDAPFTLPNRTPIAVIRFPDEAAVYPCGSNLTLKGVGYDPEDGYLPTDRLSWTLSGQGSPGPGNNLVLSGLADGEYTLTLTVADADAQHGTDAITFRIGPPRDVYLPTILKP